MLNKIIGVGSCKWDTYMSLTYKETQNLGDNLVESPL